jgi:hypothetical protein
MVTSHVGDKDYQRQCQAAEDAFTSEGGHLGPQDEFQEARTDASVNACKPRRAFKGLLNRYATGMRAGIAAFRNGHSRHAARAADPTAP